MTGEPTGPDPGRSTKVPAAVPATANTTRVLAALIDALEESPTLHAQVGWKLFLDVVGRSLAARPMVRPLPANRSHLMEIVRLCAAQPGGLAALADALERLEPDSVTTSRTRALADEWSAIDLYPDEDLTELRILLRDCEVAELPALCRAAAGPRLRRLPSYCTTAWHGFVLLTGLNAGPDGLPPSMLFLERLAAVLDRHRATELRLWTDRCAERWELTAAVATIRANIAPPIPPSTRAAYLIIQVEPDSLEADRYLMSHWFQYDADGWQPARGTDIDVHGDDIPQAVERLVGLTLSSWRGPPNAVTLEFVLPIELMSSAVDWWSVGTGTPAVEPLPARYPVVVRSLERMRERSWHRDWRARWDVLRQQPTGAVHWCQPNRQGESAPRLEAMLRAEPNVVGLVMSGPPQSAAGTGADELLAGLKSGIPLIIWHRAGGTTPAFREEIARLTADGNLRDLPWRIRDLRLQALHQPVGERDRDIGADLILLWDDPERLPNEPGPRQQ